MEKTSVKQEKRFHIGLLRFFAVLILGVSASAFGKTPSPQEIRSLVVEPDSPTFFTAQENGYTLKIPDVQPSVVQTDLPQLPPGVVYISSKKEEYIDQKGQRGTAVHLWFNFKDTGPVHLPPLIVLVGKRTYYLPFGDAVVYENPAVISPVMEISFETGVTEISSIDGIRRFTAKAGQEIIFTVNLKYFVQIIQFNWKLPENSIFKELERYEITRGVPVGTDFSSAALPVARFSWKPLVEGSYSLPDIMIFATAYNGSRKIVQVPACQIKVSAFSGGEVKAAHENSRFYDASGVFDSAFAVKRSGESEKRGSAITVEDCEKLASLRSKERHSFPGKKIAARRREFENYLGLSNRTGEIREPVVISFFVLTLVMILLSLFFLLFKKHKHGILLLAVSGIFTIISVWGIFELIPDYGIFCGGIISPVPEKITSSVHTYEGGLRVKISEEAGDFYYIESSDVNGWVLKDLVYEIE